MSKKKEYTNSQLISIAKKYETKKELRKYNKKALELIDNRDLASQAYSHMRISNKKHTHEYLMSVINQYTNNRELMKGNLRIYRYLVGAGLLKEYTKNYASVRYKYTKESISKLIKQCKTVSEFRRKYPGAFDSASRQGFLKELTKGIPKTKIIYHQFSQKELSEIAKKYETKTEFEFSDSIAFNQAKKRNLLPKICKHMINKKRVKNKYKTIDELKRLTKTYKDFEKFKKDHPFVVRQIYSQKLTKLFSHMKTKNRKEFTELSLRKIAKQYESISDFQKNDHASFMAAFRRDLLEKICSHMTRGCCKNYTKKEVLKISKNYQRRSDFLTKSPGAYAYAKRNNFIQECFEHMEDPDSNRLIDIEEVKKIAKKYKYRSDFYTAERAASEIARKRGLLDEVCAHMKEKPTVFITEKKVLNFVQQIFPEALKKKFAFNLPDRPYIKGFELDIYIPSINKAIEFDGSYWHSTKFLLSRKRNWPKKERIKYHEIKDEVFKKEHNIEILHISDTEWFESNDQTKEKIIKFLTS